MKKIKSLFSKVLEFFKKIKVKEPKQKDYDYNTEIFNKLVDNKKITSQPYGVIVENTTDELIKNVLLFFANGQNDNNFDTDGNYNKNGIIISSLIPDISYMQIVKNFIFNKVDIELTYIVSENTRQLLVPFIFKHQNTNGNIMVKTIVPYFYPDQIQKNIIVNKESYFLDGNTSFIFNEIQPKTIVKIYFYPNI